MNESHIQQWNVKFSQEESVLVRVLWGKFSPVAVLQFWRERHKYYSSRVEGFPIQTLRLWGKRFSNWSWYRSAPTGRVSPVQVFQLWRERYSCNLESRNSTTLALYNKPHRRVFFSFLFFFEGKSQESASPLTRSIWELSRRLYLPNVSLAHVELSRVAFGVFSSSELGPSLYGRVWLPVSEAALSAY